MPKGASVGARGPDVIGNSGALTWQINKPIPKPEVKQDSPGSALPVEMLTEMAGASTT